MAHHLGSVNSLMTGAKVVDERNETAYLVNKCDFTLEHYLSERITLTFL
jgi:hypothetical protein